METRIHQILFTLAVIIPAICGFVVYIVFVIVESVRSIRRIIWPDSDKSAAPPTPKSGSSDEREEERLDRAA
jgi:hypothetical protein